MDSIKYRRWFLQENCCENKFIMIEEQVTGFHLCILYPYSIDFQKMHPKVSSGEAFWTTHNKLCIGYRSATNPDIFRPIFSHKRQRLLDKVHNGKKGGEEENYSINNPHLGYARKKYLVAFNEYICVNNKKIPMDCVEIILSFIHKRIYNKKLNN